MFGANFNVDCHVRLSWNLLWGSVFASTNCEQRVFKHFSGTLESTKKDHSNSTFGIFIYLEYIDMEIYCFQFFFTTSVLQTAK